jgi:hypothetical protein
VSIATHLEPTGQATTGCHANFVTFHTTDDAGFLLGASAKLNPAFQAAMHACNAIPAGCYCQAARLVSEGGNKSRAEERKL